MKTRLSPALPPAAALVLYRGMLQDAIAAVRGSRLADEKFVYWAEAEGSTPAGDVSERVQRGEDLGARLASAFDELLVAQGDRAVILGADCPELDARLIDDALSRLERTPLVIAPSRDGGYALIALARRAPDLFEGIDWSTGRVLDQTLERARAAGIETTMLNLLDDVDTAADLCRLVANAVAPDSKFGPHTRAALLRLGLIPDAS